MQRRQTVVRSHERKNRFYLVSTIETRQYPYETMVFLCDKHGNVKDWSEVDGIRYMNVDDAMRGHEELIQAWGTPVFEIE